LLALLGARHILQFGRIRDKAKNKHKINKIAGKTDEKGSEDTSFPSFIFLKRFIAQTDT